MCDHFLLPPILPDSSSNLILLSGMVSLAVLILVFVLFVLAYAVTRRIVRRHRTRHAAQYRELIEAGMQGVCVLV